MDDNYYQSKKFAGLLKTYEEAIRDHQPLYMEADDLTDIADYYQQRGEFQKAQEAVDYALSLFPNAVAPLAFKARVAALIHGDEKEAWSYLDRIADKTDLDYYYAVAEVMLANKRAQEANQYLEEKYPLIDDEDVEDYVLDVALLFCDYQQMDYAQQWLDRSHSTEEPDYQEVEARIAMDHGDLKESGKLFNRLLDRNPFNVSYWNYLATVQYLQNDPKASIESCDYSLAINPNDPNAQLYKANGLYMLGNYEDALRLYQQLFRKDAENETAEFNIALTLINLNRPQEALPHLEHLYKVRCFHNSEHFDAVCNQLVFINAYLKRYDESFQYLKAIENLPGADMNSIYIMRGHVYLLMEEPKQAVEWFSKALSDPQANFQVCLSITDAYYDAGFVEMAYNFLLPHTALIPDEEIGNGWILLALCARELGKFEEYLNFLKKSCLYAPIPTRLMLHDYFPEGMDTKDYYQYALSHPEELNNNKTS